MIGTPRLRRALALALVIHNDYRTSPPIRKVAAQIVVCLEREMGITEEQSAVRESASYETVSTLENPQAEEASNESAESRYDCQT